MANHEPPNDDEPPPPWVAVPGLTPDEPATQGLAEAYIVLTFLPFWTALSKDRKEAYLTRWNASAEWREAIAWKYDHEGFDLEADLRDSEAWRAAHETSARRKRPWWRFWKAT